MVLPIRIAGKAKDKDFSILAHTLDFSRMGARLGAVRVPLQVGDEITLEYKRHRGRFKVRWVSSVRPEVGVQNLDPGKFVFLELPEEKYIDDIDVARLRERAAHSPAAPVAASATPKPAAEAVVKTTTPLAETAAAQATTPAERLDELKRKLRESREDTDGGLQLVATACRTLFPACGAAIALAAGDEWVCRATSGVAPRIGVHFQSPEGLTGQAAVSGQVVICRNTEEDHRVNPDIWRSVQLRSAASVPIMRQTKTLGVLEVFADRPGAFGDEHRPLFLELGALLSDLIVASTTSDK